MKMLDRTRVSTSDDGRDNTEEVYYQEATTYEEDGVFFVVLAGGYQLDGDELDGPSVCSCRYQLDGKPTKPNIKPGDVDPFSDQTDRLLSFVGVTGKQIQST